MVWVLFRHFLLKVVPVGFEPWTSWSLKGVYIPELYSVYLFKYITL